MSEKKIVRPYRVQPYVHDTYGLEDVDITFLKNVEAPYYNAPFAQKVHKGEWEEYKSYWKVDDGKLWEETLAYQLLNDSNVVIGRTCGLIVDKETNETKYATTYYLPYKDSESYFFKPSVMEEISNAVNVNTVVVLEFVFSFDEGYVLPIYHEYETGGMYAMSFADLVRDALEDLEESKYNNGDSFFLDCPNIEVNEDEINIWMSSEKSGSMELTFSNDNIGWNDIKRALSSIRIVDIKKSYTDI